MDLETVVVFGGLIWGGWVLLQIHRRRQSRRDPTATIIERPKADKNREMPRVGKPGSLTYKQIQALQQNNFEPDKNWSREEAALILDAVKYLRTVCRDIAEDDEEPDPPLDVQNELLRFILTEQDLREYVRKWGEERRAAGHGDYDEDYPQLPQNNQYNRVRQEADRFFVQERAE